MKQYIGTKIIHAEPEQKNGVDGYAVIYPDGYRSWSPKVVFEEAYQLCDQMTFGLALDALKKGFKIAREGWNGKGMWLSLSGPLEGRQIPSASFWSANNAKYASEQEGGTANVLPCITMKTADGSILMGWLASQTDLFASDWVIVDDSYHFSH